MPDATRSTISATQAPALWNRSPWLTRWMLHKAFTAGLPLDKPADARMSWGLKLEPLILAQAADELNLEVRPNKDADGKPVYERRGQLGCTRDAVVIDPTLGPGALETKVVFDYRAWMADWEGGQIAPAHYEIQLQEQMLVGDGRESFRWGVLAVWVAGEVHYLRRDPVPDLWASLDAEAAAFFADVAAGREPDPFGAAIELPVLQAIKRTGEVLDRRTDIALAEDARLYEHLTERRRAAERAVDSQKIKLLTALGDASEADCFGGIRIKVSQYKIPAQQRKETVGHKLTVKVPDDLPDALTDSLRADLQKSAAAA